MDKSYSYKRWYDTKPYADNVPLNRVFKSASCLQDEDFQNIMQGIFTSLNSENDETDYEQ